MSEEFTTDDRANAEIYATRFDHYVSKIKGDAIEAYMHDYLKRVHKRFTETDDAYVVTVHQVGNLAAASPPPGTELGTVKIVYTKPAGDGYTRSEVSVDGVRDRSEDIDVQWIRDKVDEWFDRWRGLPDPGRIGAVAQALRRVGEHLGDDDGPFGTEGEVQSWVGTLDEATDDPQTFGGSAVNLFRANFVEQLPSITRAYSAMAAYAATAMEAQKRMWDGVRAQVGEALTAIWWMFVEVRTSGSAQYNQMVRTFRFARSALDYVPQGYNIAVDEVRLVLLNSSDFVDDLKIDLRPGDFWEAWDQVGPTLDKIEQSIFDTEKKILDDVCHTLDIVGAAKNRAKFDLNTGMRYVDSSEKHRDRLDKSIAIEYAPGEVLAMHEVVVDQVCNEGRGILPTLFSHFSDYGTKILGQLDEIVASVGRDHRVGLGRYGPSEAVRDFADNLGSLLSELAWECDRTCANVKAVYDCFMQQDVASVAALGVIVSELDTAADAWGGTPYQTWDYSTIGLRRMSEPSEAPPLRRRGRS